MRKGQVISQSLVFILALIIMGMVMVFGYQALDGLQMQWKVHKLLTFKSELRTAFASISNEYETVKTKSFDVPSGFKEICFIDQPYYDEDHSRIPPDAYPIIVDYVDTLNAEPKNTFLCPPCIEQDYLGTITINGRSEAYKCIPIKSGKFSIKLRGLGNKADIITT
jgi:hypothetical protein